MKTKIFSLILSVVIVTLTAVACVQIPIDQSSAPESGSPSANVSTSAGISEPQDDSSAAPADSSVDEATSDISGEPSSEEPSSADSSAEPVSEGQPVYVVPEDYPYQNISDIGSYKIRDDDLDAYFADSVFVGNSIMVHYYNYCTGKRSYYSDFLGKSKFLCASSYAPIKEFETASEWLIKYQGEYMHSWDAIKAAGAKTAYVSLMALNELGLHATATCVKDTFDNMVKMLDKIREVNPGINIVVLSNTYMVKTFNFKNLNNRHISELNNMMLDYCNKNGVDFIDVSTALTVDGNLKYDYCLDPQDGGNGCHLKQPCYDAWTAILRNYAYAKQNGGYKNPDSMEQFK